jgi:hypothetical protein
LTAVAEIPENRVFPLDAVRLRLDEAEHPWLAANRSAVEAHWAREEVERPWLFNGTVILHRDLGLMAASFTASATGRPMRACCI